jgi:phage shock protein A
MVTYKTLEVFLEKCKKALEEVEQELEKAKKDVRSYENSTVAIEAQISTLTQLMDVENNPSTVELPKAGDKIEELFDKRLGDPELPLADEMRAMRQEGVYKDEAMSSIEALDESNKENDAGENPEVGPA